MVVTLAVAMLGAASAQAGEGSVTRCGSPAVTVTCGADPLPTATGTSSKPGKAQKHAIDRLEQKLAACAGIQCDVCTDTLAQCTRNVDVPPGSITVSAPSLIPGGYTATASYLGGPIKVKRVQCYSDEAEAGSKPGSDPK